MRRLRVAGNSLVFLVCFWPFTGAAGTPPDPLWQKAVFIASRAHDAGLEPARLEMRSTVTKPDGTIDEQDVVVYAIVQEGGESELKVSSATRNGKDVTGELKAEEARASQKNKAKQDSKKNDHEETISIEPGYHPFSLEEQARITCKNLGPVLLDGRNVVLFSFRHSGADGKSALEGKAWLDPDTGAPIQVEASPSPPPKHVDSMRSTIRFETTADGFWHPTTSRLVGGGGFLWIRRSVVSDFTFLDWRKKEAPKPQGTQK